MATTPNPKAKDAHYHAIKATAKWEAFVAELGGDLRRSAAQRAREVNERKRSTTYARGTLGGH
jgi:hypothetical protein